MLIVADWVVPSAEVEPIRGGAVRVVGDRVDAVGPASALLAAHPGDEVVDASGHAVLPGFVDAHVHLYGVLAHGIPQSVPVTGFWSFLQDYWWPKVEDALDHDAITAAVDWVCAELLRSGVTACFDVLEAPNALPDALLVEKEAAERRGMRAVLSFEATERVSPANGELGLRENARLVEACRTSPGGLVRGIVSYHTTFTCSPAFIRRAFELAEDLGVLCHAHCNEGVHEGEWCERTYGKRTVEVYDELGVLSPRFLASQCVQVSTRERELLAARGVRVTHMPLANCEVGGGIAPVPELLDAGTVVGLGSDGYVTDFYEVMRGAFLLHKARTLDPGVMPATRVLALATEGGARALGLDRVGRLEPGWAADLQVVDAGLPTPVHPHNLADQFVLWRNRSHVRDVMVAGEWRVRHGEVLGADLGAMRARVHEAAERLWAGA